MENNSSITNTKCRFPVTHKRLNLCYLLPPNHTYMPASNIHLMNLKDLGICPLTLIGLPFIVVALAAVTIYTSNQRYQT